jgi:hypothetical protein
VRQPLNPINDTNRTIATMFGALALLSGIAACTAGGQVVPQATARQIQSGRALPGPLPTAHPTTSPQPAHTPTPAPDDGGP